MVGLEFVRQVEDNLRELKIVLEFARRESS